MRTGVETIQPDAVSRGLNSGFRAMVSRPEWTLETVKQGKHGTLGTLKPLKYGADCQA
jgi:hypothetical protein